MVGAEKSRGLLARNGPCLNAAARSRQAEPAGGPACSPAQASLRRRKSKPVLRTGEFARVPSHCN
ncbi:hypothetical protein [Azospirillum largimobile]